MVHRRESAQISEFGRSFFGREIKVALAIPGIFWRMAVQPAQELKRLAHFFTRFIEVHALQSFDMPLLETRIFIRDVEEADQPAEFRIALMFRLIFGWHVAESKFANR